MLASALRTLSTILEVRPSPSLLSRSPSLVASLSSILTSPSTSVNILNLTCDLIPQLGSTKLATAQLAPLTQPLIRRIVNLARNAHLSLVAFPLESALFAFSHILTADQALFLLNSDKDPEIAQITATTLPISPAQFINSLLQLTRNPFAGVNVAAIAAITKLQYYATDPDQKRNLSQPLLPALVPFILDQKPASTYNNTQALANSANNTAAKVPPNPRVFRTLAILCRDDEAISTLALEAGVPQRLAAIVKTADTVNWTNSELIAECLLGLAAMSLHDGAFRETVISTGVLSQILQFMLAKPENPVSVAAFGLRKIKIASCHVIRALARSIALLRTSLTTVDIVDGIYELLKADPNDVVKAYERLYGPDFADKDQALEDELGIKSAVMAAVCNLIPEFSALRQTMVERGFLELIVEGAHSTYPPLLLNSLWALKHAIYALPTEHKAEVMKGLPPQYIMELCRGKEPQIQEQALSFLRNFIYGRDVELVDALLDAIGPREFFDMLEEKIVENTDAEYLSAPRGAQQDDDDAPAKGNAVLEEEQAPVANPFAPAAAGAKGKGVAAPRQALTTYRWGSATSQAAVATAKLDQRSLILLSAVYILVHLALLSDTHKDQLLQHPRLVARLLPLLQHRAAEVKVACCWVVINLTYCEDRVSVPIVIAPGGAAVPASATTTAAVPATTGSTIASGESFELHEVRVRTRAKQLVALGFYDRIRETTCDPTFDVAQRAKSAMSQLIKYS